MPHQQRNMYSETERRRARTKKQAPIHIRKTAMVKLNHNNPTALSKYNKKVLHTPHFVCTRQLAASHWTIPPKSKKQLFVHEQKLCANTTIWTSLIEQSHQTNSKQNCLCDHERNGTVHKEPSWTNWFSIFTLRDAIRKTHHFYDHNYATFVAWMALR